ncbi:protein-glutamate methylesterase/protein-glutamine glutaminase [Extibacter muris]|uniref:protein-glutamate methylesterase/protein-glutamine glutaminase n=1 Tax=Extibacter muris TaxID=1796622 RepID=UPI001D076A93|nr:chemotaxis response regulator protein-glutamate methylesterase [Extibacter muris]MCB6201371.1 chemotaxis response regulator protein-glutamate methylesterase [Extibacter muris]MCQ4662697.1 chemotaxis response regulator protein-glutamate methylesterase [Extibacter muris]MCQ4694188.1 chemotaxis response regulator protein-glutamate methylesterase [Extibacter muris]
MTYNNKIRVLVIDDSLVFDKFLCEELPKANDNIEVVGYSMNPYDALAKMPSLKPDVITLDVEMPGINGIDFLKELLPKHLLPVILVSSLNVNVFDALSNGAVDFVKKPDMSRNYTTQLFVQNLCSKILIASRARVRLPASMQPSQAAATGLSASGLPTPGISAPAQDSVQRPFSLRANNTIIAIGASTGGTEATLEIMKELPSDIPGIVITQHMPEGFTKMYAERLNRLCRMEVREARNGDTLRPGLALISPGGDLQTKVVRVGSQYSVKCYPAEKVNGHRPSVDVLFHSTAVSAGSSAVGIILTGMGQDGAEGLLHMRRAGAYTIGQDRDSCVVYGMPMVAYRMGGVTTQAPCQSIAGILVNHLKKL